MIKNNGGISNDSEIGKCNRKCNGIGGKMDGTVGGTVIIVMRGLDMGFKCVKCKLVLASNNIRDSGNESIGVNSWDG
ncbi:hypothetical protein, partial [Staphylococcus pasteuri]|uniref:hypothetical protein n=1 Tax=Staphylococcus pasteuri TaxID=45972 RepID=UPI0012B771F0